MSGKTIDGFNKKSRRRTKKGAIFTQNVDRRYRKNLEAYLKNHFRYQTMTTWDGPTSYANDVRLRNLNIPADKMDIARKLALNEVTCPDWDDFVISTVQDFYQRTGYHIGFNGKNCDYIVLYACQNDDENPGQYKVLLNKAIDPPGRFEPEKLALNDLKARAILVWELDETCDKMRDKFVQILNTYEIHEQKINKKQTLQVFEPAIQS